jgi:hypothetical protein
MHVCMMSIVSLPHLQPAQAESCYPWPSCRSWMRTRWYPNCVWTGPCTSPTLALQMTLSNSGTILPAPHRTADSSSSGGG